MIAKVTLTLELISNNGSSRKLKNARKIIEKSYLKKYSMKKVKSDEYELEISYDSDDELNRIIYSEIMQNIFEEAISQNCSMTWDAFEKSIPRHW